MSGNKINSICQETNIPTAVIAIRTQSMFIWFFIMYNFMIIKKMYFVQ